MRRLAIALVLVGLVVGASACGIPLTSSPQVISRSSLPAVLFQQQPAGTPQSTHGGSGTVEQIGIYLIEFPFGDLVKVNRSIAISRKSKLTAQKVLASLQAGPLSSEYQTGYESAINTSSDLVPLGMKGRIITIRLDHYFFELTGEAPVQELAQIVYTLTSSPLNIDAVQFVGSNGPIAVETDTRFVTRAVSQKNYCLLVATGCATAT